MSAPSMIEVLRVLRAFCLENWPGIDPPSEIIIRYPKRKEGIRLPLLGIDMRPPPSADSSAGNRK